MGTPYVEDTDIATAGDEQGVQLPAKALEINLKAFDAAAALAEEAKR